MYNLTNLFKDDSFSFVVTAARGKLCPFHHLLSWPQETLPEYSPGHHGEHFYFLLLLYILISLGFDWAENSVRISPWHKLPAFVGLRLWSLSSREEVHGAGVERADFQDEWRCCLVSWEPVSHSHAQSVLVLDRERETGNSGAFVAQATPHFHNGNCHH